MKKILLALVLIIGMNSYAEKAQAGIVAVSSSIIFTDPTDTGLMVYRVVITGVLSLGVIITGGITALFNPSIGGKIALVGLVLDQKNDGNDIYLYLKEKFPFNDQDEAVKSLAQALVQKYEPSKDEQTLTLDENSTREILARTDLSAKEISLVVSELK